MLPRLKLEREKRKLRERETVLDFIIQKTTVVEKVRRVDDSQTPSIIDS